MLPAVASSIEGISIEQFNVYQPIGSGNSNYIAIVIPGVKGRYRYDGKRAEGIISIPYRNNAYDYFDAEDTTHEFGYNGSNIQVGYIYDNGPNTPPGIVDFSNGKYLIKLSLILRK